MSAEEIPADPTTNKPDEDVQATPPALTDTPPPPKKPSRTWLIIAGVFFLLLAVGLVVALVVRSKETPEPTPTPSAKKLERYQEDVVAVKAAIENQVPDVVITEDSVEIEKVAVAIKVPGYDYYSYSEVGAGFDFEVNAADREQSDFSAVNQAIDVSTKKILELGYSQINKEISNEFLDTRYMSEDGSIVCSLGSKNSSLSLFRCGTVESAKSKADKLADFVKAYRTANPTTDTTYLLLSLGEIKNAPTAGYKTMQGGIGFLDEVSGAVTWFYQTPDGVWHFFRGGQDAASCSEYNTEDLRNAFTDDRCYGDNNEQTTVSRYFQLS